MKYDVDDLLKSTYKKGETPTDALNQTVLQMVKECADMKENNSNVKGKYERAYRGNRRKIAVAAVVVASILLLGTGVAHATMKYFGIDYFSKRYGSTGLNTDAQKLVEEAPVVTVKETKGSKDILTYKVSEVLCDSKYVIVNIDVTVKDVEKYFLIPGSNNLDDPISYMNLDIDSEQSIRDYCKEHGMQPVQLDFPYDSKSEKNVEYMLKDNEQSGTGKASVMLCSKRLTTDRKFTMSIKPSVIISKGEKVISTYNDDVLQIQVEDNSSEESACYAVNNSEEYKVPGTSMVLQEVKVTTTEVGSYLYVTYKNTGSSEDATAEFIELSDKNGEMLPSSIVAVGRCQPKGNNIYACEGCYENIGLPDAIYLSIGEGTKIVKMEKV